MNDTMTVMKPCEHGIYAPHYLDGPSNRVCPGGKEIRLRRQDAFVVMGGLEYPTDDDSGSAVWVEVDGND